MSARARVFMGVGVAVLCVCLPVWPSCARLPALLPVSQRTNETVSAWCAGIYNITGKETKEFPKDCLKLSNLRVLTLEKCQLEQVPMLTHAHTHTHTHTHAHTHKHTHTHVLQVPPEIGQVAGTLQKMILPSNKLRSLPAQLGALINLQQIDLRSCE